MSFIDRAKHLPKWAWLTAAGVSAGAVGIKLTKSRAKPGATQTADSAATQGDVFSGNTLPATTGSSPPGVIVPPIITGGNGDGGSGLGEAALTLVGGWGGALTDLLGTVVTGDQETMRQMVNSQTENQGKVIDLLAGAGSAPQPVISNPAPIINIAVPTPAAPPAPVPVRAPVAAPVAPVVIAGKVFPGAISHHINGGGRNAYGLYVQHDVVYPGGRTEHWWHYTQGSAAGKWTGPH